MSGLQSRDSFVGNGKTWKPKQKASSARGKIIVAVAVFITVSVTFGVFALSYHAGNGSSISGNYAFREVKNDIGVGNTTPAIAVDSAQSVFAIAWYGYDTQNQVWNLNVTLIGSTDGSIFSTETITQDIAIYYGKPSGKGPRIIWDPDDAAYLLIWYSQDQSIDGVFLDDHAQIVDGPFVINGTVKVYHSAFGLSYIGHHNFVVSWADTSSYHHSWYRVVTYNSGSSPPHSFGPVTELSSDTTHSHINHASAFSSGLGQVAFVWRNSTGTGYYNITAAIYSGDMGSKIWNDFTVADGATDAKDYDIPNVVGGDNAFFVVYAETSSPYTIHGAILKDNSVTTRITIGDSYYGVKYYGIGIAYNGSDEYLVVWPDSNKNIVASLYDLNGDLKWQKIVVSDGNKNEAPAVAIDTTQSTYQFVWYDYTNGIVRTSFWTESELVPELGALAPLLAIVLPAIIVIRNRRQRA